MQVTCAETDRRTVLPQNLEVLNSLTENDILLIETGRTLDTVAIILECLNRLIGFTFSRGKHFDATCVITPELEVNRLNEVNHINKDICYVINTSGTTGTSKRVAVPYNCIMSNVKYFGEILEIRPTDKILFSTSLHFDPSIIEIFLSANFNTELIMTPDNYRSQPHLLSKTIKKYRPTIGQFTPNVAKMLDDSSLSIFRCLMIGGARFPDSSCLTSLKTTRVFDVYGVTEVSCWATIREITSCIHLPIPGTTIKISEDGELILAGNRRCFVNGELTSETGHCTGDLVEIDKDQNWRIIGRKDSQIKVRGMRMNLEEMTRQISISGLEAYFLLYREKIIVLFVQGDNKLEEKTRKIVKDTLPVDFHPSHIEFVQKFKVTRNGKIDENFLRQKLDIFYNGKFIQLVREKYNIQLDENLNQSFVDLGFDSLTAAELSLCFDENADEVFRSLLDPNITVAMFLDRFKIEKNVTPATNSIRVKVEEINSLPLKWKHDLKKCIDGNALIINQHVYTASHYGIVMCVELTTGRCVWQNNFETRFEATPIDVDGDVVLGGYNGVLYCFDGSNGAVKWQFTTGDQIKAPGCYDNRDSIYFISYDGFLYRVEKKNGEQISKIPIGAGSPAPPIVNAKKSTVICSTIRGRIIANTWQYAHTSACFAAPTYDAANLRLLCAFVDGTTVWLSEADGAVLSALRIGAAPVFCAPLKIETGGWCWALESGEVVMTDEANCQILGRWKFDGCRFVRTPQYLPNRQKILLTSTNGTIIIWQLANSTAKSIRLSEAAIFSSPVFEIKNRLLISTGRDDWIKCWKFPDLFFD